MRLMSEQTRRARAVHRAAREELARVSERDGEETDATVEANSRVIETEKTLPWWKRIDIDCTVG